MLQELHEMFELVFFYHDGDNIYICILLGNWGGDGCHSDSVGQVGQ